MESYKSVDVTLPGNAARKIVHVAVEYETLGRARGVDTANKSTAIMNHFSGSCDGDHV